MDYEKLTKAELIEKINEQKHLASAVEAKDAEIVSIKKKYSEENNALANELSTLKASTHGMLRREEIEKITKATIEEKEKFAKIAKYYVVAYRDLIKTLKLNTDIAIAHEEVLAELLK